MRQRILLAIKVIVYCFFVWLIQTSLITDLYLTDIQVNLIFASLIVFASRLSMYEVIIASVFFTLAISSLIYDSQIYWFYPLGAVIAKLINPDFIPDKFLICILYTLLFTPMFEFMSTSSTPFIDRTMEAVLLNVATIIPLYIVVSLIFVAPSAKQN